MKLTDARVVATRAAIQRSFLALLKEKPISRITVKEICALSQINRSTFYKHYADPLDVLEKLENELFEKLTASVENGGFRDLREYLNEALCGMERCGEMYLTLASPNGDPALHAKMFRRLYEMAYPAFERNFPDLSPAQRDMAYQFVQQGSGGILAGWFRSGMTVPREEVLALLLTMTGGAIRELRKEMDGNGDQ